MANYYFVKSGGTAGDTDNGRYTQAEYDAIGADAFANAGSTGGATNNDWDARGLGAATNYYYDNIEEVCDNTTMTAEADGDYLLVSSAHDFTSSTYLYYLLGSSTKTIYLISVDDTDVTTPLAGAKEKADPAGLAGSYMWYNVVVVGCSFTSAHYWYRATAGTWVCHDCTFDYSKNTSGVWSSDGGDWELHNCNIRAYTGTQNLLWPVGGSHIRMYGGAIDSVNDSYRISVMSQASGSGGGTALFDGVDLTAIHGSTGGSPGFLSRTQGNDRVGDDAMDFTFRNCQLHEDTDFHNEDYDSINQRLTVTNCAPTSAEAEYQFFIHAFGGEVEDDTSVWRAESRSFPSGKFVSAKVTTTGNVCEGAPFTFELPARWATLSTTDTIRIYLASTTALTKELTWATLIYADGTNNHDANYLTSKPADWMSSGTALATDSTSSWRDGTQPTGDALAGGYNFYQIDLDCSTVASGADSAPLITIHCAEAAATEIFIDTTVDVV